jgi:site-specific DNA-methyltransferase (adenine-specific)
MEVYLDNTLKWVKEVYRVLKPSGSFVLNIGDTFFTKRNTKAKEQVDNSLGYKQYRAGFSEEYGFYKSKQLLSISSFAYCRIISETDFICRGEHLWCKPNVPSPIRSRLKHSHEKLFWFVKDADKYYFDETPWLKDVQNTSLVRNKTGRGKQPNYGMGREFQAGDFISKDKKTIEHSWRIVSVGERQQGFEICTERPKSEHIAPFPSKLIEPYILSLCPTDGTILDTFLGSGTTMRVAMENGRNCTGIELNSSYIDYAKKRVNWKHCLNIEYSEHTMKEVTEG